VSTGIANPTPADVPAQTQLQAKNILKEDSV
jgi:hypothetical protein